MQIWPHSATLSEVGAAQAGNTTAQGGMGGGMGGGTGFAPMPGAGEIMLSRAETAALAALEGEEDEDHGLRRAQAESGLSRQQLRMLQRRANHLSSKGYTLKGYNFTKKPLASNPDEPGLSRSAVKGDDADANPPKKTAAAAPAKKKAAATKEAAPLVTRVTDQPDLYTCGLTDSYRLPAPNSLSEPEVDEKAKETNSMTTLATMMAKRRRAKYGR